jgi:hypothetical protein
MTTSPQAATTVLLAAGFGFIGTTVVNRFIKAPEATPKGDPPLTDDNETAESLMAGAFK